MRAILRSNRCPRISPRSRVGRPVRKNTRRCARKSHYARSLRTAWSSRPYSSGSRDQYDSLSWAAALLSRSFPLLVYNVIGDGPRIQRQATVIFHASQFRNIGGVKFKTHQPQHLRIAVLLHDINALVAADEIQQVLRKRICPEAQITRLDAVLGSQLVAAL